MFQIDLAPSGDLLLFLPTGRKIEIPASPEGVGFVQKILRDYYREVRNAPGYIEKLPTQHVINKWIREESVKKKAKDLGVDVFKLEIRI